MKNQIQFQQSSSLKENSRGVALVVVLIALILATSLGLAVASTTTTEVQIAASTEASSKGFYYAEIGLNAAVAIIQEMRGDFNDLLAGPDALSASGTNEQKLNSGLESHGSELVIGGAGGWPNTTATLVSSGLQGPMFPPDVKSFAAPINSPVTAGGDDRPNLADIKEVLTTAALTTAAAQADNANWGGRLEFDDPSTASIYRVYVEIYDDDDPFARLFDAWPGSIGQSYPRLYGDIAAPVFKVPGAPSSSSPTATNYNLWNNCSKEFVECPGSSQSSALRAAFSGRNSDRNAKVLIRATARQIKNMNGTLRVVSESVLDSIVGFFPYPAVITEGCALVRNGVTISGAYGGIHANDGLCVNLSGAGKIDQSATSSTGLCNGCTTNTSSPCNSGICGFAGGNQARLDIPDLNSLPAVGDPTPPSPQTAAVPVANPSYSTNGWFWVKTVQNLNSGRSGADYIYLSPKNTPGSQRTRRHGATEDDGLLYMLTGMTEGAFTTWCNNRPGAASDKPDPAKALVFDRVTVPGHTIVTSFDNSGNIRKWYSLNDGQQKVGPTKADIGFAPGGGAINGTDDQCGTCPPREAPPGTPSRSSNGETFSCTAGCEPDPSNSGRVYFFDGNVKLAGNMGTNANPKKLTIITTGAIDIAGTPNIRGFLKANLAPLAPPFTSPLLTFVAGTDIAFTGDLSTSVTFEGVLYAREQISMTGSSQYAGQMIAADRSSDDNAVEYNTLAGNATVSFSGSTSALGNVRKSSYRKLKF